MYLAPRTKTRRIKRTKENFKGQFFQFFKKWINSRIRPIHMWILLLYSVDLESLTSWKYPMLLCVAGVEIYTLKTKQIVPSVLLTFFSRLDPCGIHTHWQAFQVATVLAFHLGHGQVVHITPPLLWWRWWSSIVLFILTSVLQLSLRSDVKIMASLKECFATHADYGSKETKVFLAFGRGSWTDSTIGVHFWYCDDRWYGTYLGREKF